MPTVNVLEAKTHLSRLIDDVESGREREIIIARKGKPAVRIAPLEAPEKQGVKIGLAKGKYTPLSWEEEKALNEEIITMFEEGVTHDREHGY